MKVSRSGSGFLSGHELRRRTFSACLLGLCCSLMFLWAAIEPWRFIAVLSLIFSAVSLAVLPFLTKRIIRADLAFAANAVSLLSPQVTLWALGSMAAAIALGAGGWILIGVACFSSVIGSIAGYIETRARVRGMIQNSHSPNLDLAEQYAFKATGKDNKGWAMARWIVVLIPVLSQLVIRNVSHDQSMLIIALVTFFAAHIFLMPLVSNIAVLISIREVETASERSFLLP